MKVKIDQRQLERKVAKSLKALADKKAMALIANKMFKRGVESINQQKDYKGTPYAPLKEKTTARKAKAGRSSKALIWSGEMRNTIIPKSTTTKAQAISPKKYSSYHNEGTKKIPKRQFLGISKQDKKEYTEILKKRYIEPWQ